MPEKKRRPRQRTNNPMDEIAPTVDPPVYANIEENIVVIAGIAGM